MTDARHSVWTRLYRGETSFDFVNRRRRWFAISGTIIAIGILSLVFRGLNFSIDFKGGTVWEVNTSASVTKARQTISKVDPALGQATIEVLTNHQTGAKTLRISAEASATSGSSQVAAVSQALATMAQVNVNQITLTDVGPTWGSDITHKAEEALVIFLVAVVLYISFRFETKMAIAALVALVHDLLVTAGVYSLSGFQVSPDTVIAFLTILGYSLYDTIVVFDKIEENTKGLAASQRITYTETVNLSMNQVLMRSINTSIVAIMPIASILVVGVFFLGATALEDFGLALFIGLLTGAYSSIFIASPLLAAMKEREPRYSQIRQRLATRASVDAVLTPAAAASGELLAAVGGASGSAGGGRNKGGQGGGGRGSGGGRKAAAPKSSTKESDGKDAAFDDGEYVGPVRPKQRTASKAAPAPAPASKAVPTKAVRKAAPATATPALSPEGNAELGLDEGEDHTEVSAAPAVAPTGAAGPGSAASSGAGTPRPAGAGTPRQPAKPRPGPANRAGGGGGGGANRGAPRPRKKGKRR